MAGLWKLSLPQDGKTGSLCRFSLFATKSEITHSRFGNLSSPRPPRADRTANRARMERLAHHAHHRRLEQPPLPRDKPRVRPRAARRGLVHRALADSARSQAKRSTCPRERHRVYALAGTLCRARTVETRQRAAHATRRSCHREKRGRSKSASLPTTRAFA